MATSACNSIPTRPLTRPEKRLEYNHSLQNSLSTYRDLRNDLIRIGHQYFDYSANITDIGECLRDAWDEFIFAAKIIPSGSSEHDRLVTLVMEMRELGGFVRKRSCKDGGEWLAGDKEEEVAMLPNGQRLWTDLPFLGQVFQDFWFAESTGLSVIERNNLAVLTAKLCAVGVCSGDLAGCALWLFKETLETERPLSSSISSARDDDHGEKDPRLLVSVSDLFPACIEWLNHSAFKLAKLSASNITPSLHSSQHQLSTSPGHLATKAGITEQGFSIARWLFWRQRLRELYISSSDDEQVAKCAREGFEIMASTGMAVGIDIPGERRYLERLFEALDKELVARGSKGCVGPEDIEIDPAWATEGRQ